MISVQHVHPNQVAQLLPEVVPFIEMGMAHATTYNTEHVKLNLANGTWHLLVATEKDKVVGAYVLTYNNEPNDRTAFVISAGGRGLAGDEAVAQLFAIAKSFGATKMQTLARKSAARLYTRAGLKEKATLMEIKL